MGPRDRVLHPGEAPPRTPRFDGKPDTMATGGFSVDAVVGAGPTPGRYRFVR